MMYSKKIKQGLKSLLSNDPVKRQIKKKKEEEKIKRLLNKDKLKRNLPKIGK